mgnify:CR=1 FL=1
MQTIIYLYLLFKNLGGIVSGDILSTNVAGGFTGNMIGLYATSANMAHPQ